jgi:biopolymer transport protein ExbD
MTFRTRHSDSNEFPEQHEINVTPFIDVILVLLIIFMVAAPLATVETNVDLPSSNAPLQQRPATPVFLTIFADRTLAVGRDRVAAAVLGQAVDAAAGADPEARIFLRADKTVDYDTLMQTINALRAAGYAKIALVGLDSVD